ncbi:MAG: ornithine carbamoyltransferase [Planctomycetales bacterium]
MKHLTSLSELTTADVKAILASARELKDKFLDGDRPPLLRGRVLTMIFEKPSLRTRNSFEAAITHLGGGSTFLSVKDAGLDGRESLADVARVLGSYADALVLRTFSQRLIEEFASYAACPVINGLSDERHPCQALTDAFTMQEVFGDIRGKRLVFVGDGNNVAASLSIAAAMLGFSFTLCGPRDYWLDDALLADLRAKHPDANLVQTDDIPCAVRDADVIYTDVWASMGQEAEAEKRKSDFGPYQVNTALMAQAPKSCRFMHDLPAKRGLEVTDEVIDGPPSLAFQQAENRLHLAKGLLAWLLDAR